MKITRFVRNFQIVIEINLFECGIKRDLYIVPNPELFRGGANLLPPTSAPVFLPLFLNGVFNDFRQIPQIVYYSIMYL